MMFAFGKWCRFTNDAAIADDVVSLMFFGEHRIIATNGSNIIMQSITSYRRQAMHH